MDDIHEPPVEATGERRKHPWLERSVARQRSNGTGTLSRAVQLRAGIGADGGQSKSTAADLATEEELSVGRDIANVSCSGGRK